MKKIVLIISLCMSYSALAGNGQAVIPHFIASSNSSCHLHISNVSQNDVEVDIDIFNQNGVAYSTNIASFYAFSGTNPVTSTVTLQSKQTGAISINPNGSGVVGFGYIRWSSSNDQPSALVADLHCNNNTNKMQRSVVINGSLPF